MKSKVVLYLAHIVPHTLVSLDYDFWERDNLRLYIHTFLTPRHKQDVIQSSSEV